MTEDRSTHFDSEVRKLVMKKNGGEVTPELFWSITAALGEDVASLIDAVNTVNAGGETRHADTLRLLAIHTDEDFEHRKQQARECAATHANLLEQMTRRAPRRSTDPADAVFADMGRELVDPVTAELTYETGTEAVASRRAIQSEDRRVWVMWGVGIFLATIIANAVVVWFVVHALEEL
jgi:hypothetical protein